MTDLGCSSGSGAASKAAAAGFDTSAARISMAIDLGPIPAFARRVFADEHGVFFSTEAGAGTRPAPPNGVRASARPPGLVPGETHPDPECTTNQEGNPC
jgi:hypothetical protein